MLGLDLDLVLDQLNVLERLGKDLVIQGIGGRVTQFYFVIKIMSFITQMFFEMFFTQMQCLIVIADNDAA